MKAKLISKEANTRLEISSFVCSSHVLLSSANDVAPKFHKIQILSVLSDLECFVRSWDAMQGVEVQIRVLEPRMKHLITKCTLKLSSAP